MVRGEGQQIPRFARNDKAKRIPPSSLRSGVGMTKYLGASGVGMTKRGLFRGRHELGEGEENGEGADLLRLHHGEQGTRALRGGYGISDGAGASASGGRRWRVHALVSGASAGLLCVVSECGRRDRARDADQEVAAGEEGGADSRAESDVGGFGGGVGRGGGDEGVRDSGFLTGLGARFGMTKVWVGPDGTSRQRERAARYGWAAGQSLRLRSGQAGATVPT